MLFIVYSGHYVLLAMLAQNRKCQMLSDPGVRTPIGASGNIGPSGVRALPLAFGINEDGHYCQNPNSTNNSIELNLRLDYILTP
jgi:hypothetical protein